MPASAFDSSRLARRGPPPPVDLLWGEADRSHRRTDPRSALALAPHARWIARPGCGHFPDLEAPDAFVELLADRGGMPA